MMIKKRKHKFIVSLKKLYNRISILTWFIAKWKEVLGLIALRSTKKICNVVCSYKIKEGIGLGIQK
jgi:hypothetical protein